MLKLTPNPTFKTSVKIHVPGSKPESVRFEFIYMDKAAWDEFNKPQNADKRTDVDTLMAIVKDWDQKDVDEPFSREALERLLNAYIGASFQIAAVYADELTKARPGN